MPFTGLLLLWLGPRMDHKTPIWCRKRQQKFLFAGRYEAGATGLEPATSGVTGHFEGREVDDDRHRMPLFVRPFPSVPGRVSWLSGAVPDVCCPIAARREHLSRPGSRRRSSCPISRVCGGGRGRRPRQPWALRLGPADPTTIGQVSTVRQTAGLRRLVEDPQIHSAIRQPFGLRLSTGRCRGHDQARGSRHGYGKHGSCMTPPRLCAVRSTEDPERL
jgi:hypothetical protein